jgi:hypothetical protein
MRDRHPVILGRDAELAVLAAAADAAEAGHGAFVLVEGPAGIGKTTLLRMACARPPAPGPRILTARGLALESGFAYGIARQLIEPVRASAGPGEWDELLDGAAGLAARVFDWAGAGSVEDDVPYATTHGLYWLAANLAARRPLVIAVDDAHWADARHACSNATAPTPSGSRCTCCTANRAAIRGWWRCCGRPPGWPAGAAPRARPRAICAVGLTSHRTRRTGQPCCSS